MLVCIIWACLLPSNHVTVFHSPLNMIPILWSAAWIFCKKYHRDQKQHFRIFYVPEMLVCIILAHASCLAIMWCFAQSFRYDCNTLNCIFDFLQKISHGSEIACLRVFYVPEMLVCIILTCLLPSNHVMFCTVL